MGSNPAAPTIKPYENKEKYAPTINRLRGKVGTFGIRGAGLGTKNPEKVPNGVPFSFPIIIAEWDRNKREVIRVALDQYNGRHTVNVRVWYRDGDGLKPDKTGITLSLSHLSALAGALVLADRRACELGLIGGGEQ
ncbi:MAG: transcriptional coactivator p15/PC4 family protein [Xanthobacteraceae bacterium]|nr:transcriptional coactivator p15/PC4 family protein [Xanthobacteraceae bacterium]